MRARSAPAAAASSRRSPHFGLAKIAGLAVLAVLVVLLTAPPAHPWGAFRGVAGIKVTDTHQLILRAAYDLLRNDSGMRSLFGIPIAGGRFASIDSILNYEGVDASLTALAPYGPGPDAEGSTLYSSHWFNPSTGRGLGPQAAADWYQRFVRAVSGLAGNDEDAFKGLAWSAHFLADMFVPYHLNGMPADEALARINARNFIIGPNEAGPAFLIDPVPAPQQQRPGNLFETQLQRGQEALSSWWRDGWGVGSNFRGPYAVFAANNQAAAGNAVNHLDWFDPWYWNGVSSQEGRLTDPSRALFSSHASYESAAHERFVADQGYRSDFNRPNPYDPLWNNAPPDYEFTGTAGQAQAWQVQDFAARAAARTLQNAELCWTRPEIAIRAAVEAVYTMWRSAYSALLPVIEIGVDPTRPDDGIVVNVIVQNHAWEACHDVRLRIRVGKGGQSAVSQDVASLDEPIARSGGAQRVWFVQVNPREDWTVAIEAVGVYDKTPDLQYARSYAFYRPDPSRQPARAVEEATSYDFVGSFTHTDPNRSYEQYHGEMTLNPDGTFQDIEYLNKGTEVRRGSGSWKFDPFNMTVSVDWQPGGEFAGPVSGNTSDFTINGRWSNGGSGTLRFQRR
jgi:hypothetical protein